MSVPLYETLTVDSLKVDTHYLRGLYIDPYNQIVRSGGVISEAQIQTLKQFGIETVITDQQMPDFASVVEKSEE